MKRLLFLVIFSLVLIMPASAWGPHTHTLIAENLFAEQDSEVIRMCTPYQDAFLAGSVIPDITVVYYYSEGGKNYRLTHNWNFQQEVMNQARTDDEKCFAYGIAAHLIADGVIHMEIIPDAIESSSIPNWLIHPLLEKKYDSVLVKQYPHLKDETPHMLDAMFGPKGDRYFEMVEAAIGDNPVIDVRSDTHKLSLALGTFYESAYKPRGETWMFRIYPLVDDLTNMAEPLASDANLGHIHYYFLKSVEQTNNVYNNWGTRYSISPHGFEELSEADESAGAFGWLMMLSMLIPLGIAVWRRQPLWLLLIPVKFIMLVVAVYIFV